jgi:hypothetical protein
LVSARCGGPGIYVVYDAGEVAAPGSGGVSTIEVVVDGAEATVDVVSGTVVDGGVEVDVGVVVVVVDVGVVVVVVDVVVDVVVVVGEV